ncbi:MAG: type II secretion system protein [Sedimentisphaeraceae bacterium JB056]
MKKMTPKQGFTLIELLVVISIIAILMAVMMPALGKAREVAKNVICRSNIKGIGTASLLWSEDNENWVLPALWDRGNSEGDSLLLPYLGDAEAGSKVMLCPAVPAKYAGKTYEELGLEKDVAGLANGGNYYNSYGYNMKLCAPTSQCPGSYDKSNDDGSTWGKDGVWYKKHGNCKLFSIRKPSTTIMFAESIVYLSYPEYYTKAMANPAFSDPAARGRRHNPKKRRVGSDDVEYCGNMNIAWMDGSVSEEPDDMDIRSDDGRTYNINGNYWYGK